MAAPTISVLAIIDVKHGDAICAQKKHGLLMRLRKLQRCRWLMITSPSISWDLTWVVYPPVLSSPRHQRLPVAQKLRRAWSRSRWRLWRRQLRQQQPPQLRVSKKVPVPSLVLLSKAIAVQVSFWWCRKDINPYSFGFLSHSIHWSNRLLLYLFWGWCACLLLSRMPPVLSGAKWLLCRWDTYLIFLLHLLMCSLSPQRPIGETYMLKDGTAISCCI